MNNPTTADRIDQLIWGEIPVAPDDQYRPYAWRNADDHRTSRWTEKVTLEEHEIHKDDEKFSEMLEEQIDGGNPLNSNEISTFNFLCILRSIVK